MRKCRNMQDAAPSPSHVHIRWYFLSGAFDDSERAVCAAAGRSAQWGSVSGHLEPGLFTDPLAEQSLGDGQAGVGGQAAGGGRTP